MEWLGIRAAIGLSLAGSSSTLLLIAVLPRRPTQDISGAGDLRHRTGVTQRSERPLVHLLRGHARRGPARLRSGLLLVDPDSLQVYVTDAKETSSGGFGLLAPGQITTGVDSWASLPPGLLTVRVSAKTADGPGQVIVPLTVRIPDNAAPGDHVGGIVVSLRSVGTNSTGQDVVLLQRVGTRVFIRVAGKLVPRASIEDLRPSYQATINPLGAGRVKVSYVLTNTGNVDLALNHQIVSVSGLLETKQSVLGGTSLLIPGAWPRRECRFLGNMAKFCCTRQCLPARMRPRALVRLAWCQPWPVPLCGRCRGRRSAWSCLS